MVELIERFLHLDSISKQAPTSSSLAFIYKCRGFSSQSHFGVSIRTSPQVMLKSGSHLFFSWNYSGYCHYMICLHDFQRMSAEMGFGQKDNTERWNQEDLHISQRATIRIPYCQKLALHYFLTGDKANSLRRPKLFFSPLQNCNLPKMQQLWNSSAQFTEKTQPAQDHNFLPCLHFAPLGLIAMLIKQDVGQVLT